MKLIRIATRNSPLALWQANYIEQRLLEEHQELTVEIVGMTTKGDQLLDRSLATVGGKGLFLKELESSLLKNETDIAVHSMKDVPVHLPEGLEISVVCDREDPRDAFISNNYQNLYALPKGAIVGTSSLRRVSQLKKSFPELEFIELRGNVNTRLAKLDDGDYDAIILAAAGLIRLNLVDRIKQYISPELCIPAVGQGIVGIECRSDDEKTKQLIAPLHSQISALALAAERAMNAALEGGCQLPVAGFAEIDKGKIRLRGMVGHADGSECLYTDSEIKKISLDSATKLGRNAAKELLHQGAGEILSALTTKAKEAQMPIVILTREEKYVGKTRELLKSLDYLPKHIEALTVEPKYDDEVLNIFDNIDQFTDILFVSRNAVEFSVQKLKEHSDVLKSKRIMAVGSETAKQLFGYGIDALFPEVGHGAEALLNVEQLQELAGRKILIVRGKYGLDWPAEEMKKRGAEVISALCYQQVAPKSLGSQIEELFSQDSAGPVKGVFLHSSISTINFLAHFNKYPDKIKDTKLIVGSQQIAATAKYYGWVNEIAVAKSPSNKHMMIAFSGKD